MKSLRPYLPLAVLALALHGAATAQADVIVGSLNGVSSYGTSGGIAAYAIGTTSCNVGTVPLLWIASTNQHPVIGQNIYRVKDGVFEQVGMSWLKHGFTALQGNLCTPCNANPNGSALGVGCSDPYGSGLNGSQGGLGPRWQVNPLTGAFPYPFNSPAITDSTISRRVQVDVADVDPAQNVGASYFAEGHYIAPDDAAAGNGLNNASYATISFGGAPSFNANPLGPTVRGEPAIMAWPTVDTNAQVITVDNSGERFYVGFNAISLGGGQRRFVYAVHNLNSDRAGGSFTVSLPSGATATNLTFSGKTHHSGELWSDTTAWSGALSGSQVRWTAPQTFAQNPNARALRWGQTFTFTFESNATPTGAAIGFFKVGGSLNVPAFTLPTELWQTNSPSATLTADGQNNNGFLGPIRTTLQVGSGATVTMDGNANAPFDVILQPGNAVASNAGGLLVAPGQILNLDLADPVRPFSLLNNGFGAILPPAGINVLFFGGSPLEVCAQLVAVDAASPIGLSLSAANEIDVVTCTATTVNHTLSDDSTVQVTLGIGGAHDCLSQLDFYGTSYSSFFVNSNGSVSFGTGSTDFSSTVAEFRSGPARFAGMWTDLNPAIGGTITTVSNAGTVSVVFTNVPQFGNASRINSFEMAMTEGSSVVSLRNYVRAAAHSSSTLIGVSPGGNAPGNSLTYSTLSVGASQNFPANQAIYEFISNGAPSGFTSLDFDTGAGATSVTRVL